MFNTAYLDLAPLEEAGGTVVLPGSKSISNRVLLLAALCSGTTRVHDLLDSDDTRVMLDALRALGCSVVHHGAAIDVTGLGRLAVSNANPSLPEQAGVRSAHHQPTNNQPTKDQHASAGARRLFLGNAGTAMRPLTAALALLGGEFEMSGVARMHERPIGDLVDALRELGCRIDYLGNEGFPPLRIHPAPALKLDAPIPVRGDVSSQFLTALLMALPLASHRAPTPGTDVSGLPPEGAASPRGGPSTGRDIVIEVVGELISKPYIEITLNMLERFGIAVRREGWQRFTIPAGSQYRSPDEIHVEADASSASYFVALGALAATGQPVRIEGVGASSIQGDIRFVEAAQRMGADVASGPNWLDTSPRTGMGASSFSAGAGWILSGGKPSLPR